MKASGSAGKAGTGTSRDSPQVRRASPRVDPIVDVDLTYLTLTLIWSWSWTLTATAAWTWSGIVDRRVESDVTAGAVPLRDSCRVFNGLASTHMRSNSPGRRLRAAHRRQLATYGRFSLV